MKISAVGRANILIHQNKTLNEFERFNYLRRYLAGQALAAISGFIFDSETYQEALKILIERYENTQVLISFYIETLVKIYL